MRSNGFATILLMIPVLTVPALAIFGIPQFAPVVASSPDEGSNQDRESRVGNSARKSHDEFFRDLEGFGSEPDGIDDSAPKLRRSGNSSNADFREGKRRSKESDIPSLDDDLTAESEWPRKKSPANRRSLAEDSDGHTEPDSISGTNSLSGSKSPKRSKTAVKSSRDRTHAAQTGNGDDEIRLASASDVDAKIVSAAFQDDLENSRAAMNGKRPRIEEPRAAKRRESATEPLTWPIAVERLNQMDIRSFRLEPGHQLGEFVFICSYTPPETPSVSYRFEAGAEEPLKAVEKVLEQIVEWQQRR